MSFTVDRFTQITPIFKSYFKLNLILCRESPVDGYSKSAELNLVHIFNFETNAFKIWEYWQYGYVLIPLP